MKNKTISFFLFVCAICAFGRIGSAQRHDSVVIFWSDGNKLLETCSEPTVLVGDVVPAEKLVAGARNNGMCAGYIAGINDNEMTQVASGKALSYCLPDGMSMSQMAKVVRKYVEDNPAKRNAPASILVTSGLKQAFPCR